MSTAPLLRVENLTIGATGPGSPAIVDNVSLTLAPGATLGIAGESGCGKSTLLLAMMGIVRAGLRRMAGSCAFDGVSLFEADPRRLERIRGGRLALVPQSAGLSLTPTLRVGEQIDEVLMLHTGLDPQQRRRRVVELLDSVHLPMPARIGRRYPHELSGGQLQRVAIAMALAAEPALLLLDEPTTGLDVTTQIGILDLLAELRARTNVAMVYVSHDLGSIAHLAERMIVMYAGQVVEDAPTADLLRAPAHPYARGLMASIPRLAVGAIPAAIPGRPPAPGEAPPGCRFAPRCAAAQAVCRREMPILRARPDGRLVACHFADARPMTSAAPATSGPRSGRDAAALLTIEALKVTYDRPALLRRPRLPHAVDGVSLALRPGEILGLVGESGSGKSTILRCIAGLWPPLAGEMRYGRQPLDAPAASRERSVLRAIQFVFQNPDASLNPRQTVREILSQPLRLYFGLRRRDMADRLSALLSDVRLDDSYLDRYPAELSGGERQRVAIARAYAAEPDILLLDEVTSALDVSVQASILQLIRELSATRGTACVLVSHDLAVVQALADRIAVLYRGRLVEMGPAGRLCRSPAHPYTRALIGAVLEPEPMPARRREGTARDRDDRDSAGCLFAGRCPVRLERCFEAMPDWQVVDGDHQACCVHLEPARPALAV